MSNPNCEQSSLPYKELLYSPQQVTERIREMAHAITVEYDSLDTSFVSLLKGAVPFTAKLMFMIAELDPTYHPNVDYVTISRYGLGQSPTDKPNLIQGLAPNNVVEGKRVVMLDDMVDGGGTAEFGEEYLLECGAESVDLIVLGGRQNGAGRSYEPAIVGFDDLPPREVWLTGMGLDHRRLAPEANRWFGGIAIALDLPPTPDELAA